MILTLVLEYTDAKGSQNADGSTTCDLACWTTQTFSTTSTSVHGMLYDGSYGAVSVVQQRGASASKRVVVNMGKAAASLASCADSLLEAEARGSVRSARCESGR